MFGCISEKTLTYLHLVAENTLEILKCQSVQMLTKVSTVKILLDYNMPHMIEYV